MGQREEAALGLYFYNARWYDPALGHFLSPDCIVPEAGNALDYHRYAYVRFNPLKYEDESGHCATLANGEADWENDAECWQLAYAIYGYGLDDGPLARRFAAGVAGQRGVATLRRRRLPATLRRAVSQRMGESGWAAHPSRAVASAAGPVADLPWL